MKAQTIFSADNHVNQIIFCQTWRKDAAAGRAGKEVFLRNMVTIVELKVWQCL